MKKTILTLAAVAAASYASYGQGVMTFSSTTALYDDFTSGTPTKAGDMYVDFVWIAGTGSSLLGSATTAGGSVSWAQIENLSVGTTGSSWGLGSASELALTDSAPPPAVGEYTDPSTFSLASMAAGDVISMYVFAWNEADGSTVAAAAAANAAIGWSGEITYTLGSSSSPGGPLGAAGGGFDVDSVTATPEPTTIALAGLGGLSMLFLRRRKA